MEAHMQTPITIYKRISHEAVQEKPILAKFRIELPDRPGSLAGFASTLAQAGGNIAFFHYDRSIDSSRVAVEVQLPDEPSVGALAAALEEREFHIEEVRAGQDDVVVTTAES